ncbi:RraA family protein [Mangrovicoccus ximenensis]|uniref:hypothetical protein n=1 Tax=Mangrovicoccus ximenensis TaxID=1911570 RepID=UPI000D3983C2|nr:hypothetical protein [Mangrovicoccus ximenensis]
MTISDRLLALGSATLSDVLDEAGFQAQTLSPAIRPVSRDAAFCGPALCIGLQRRVATRTARGPRPGSSRCAPRRCWTATCAPSWRSGRPGPSGRS